jgi:PKD repeat protein
VTLDPVPDVSYSTDSDTACVNAVMQFYGQSATASTWYWDFGDGGSSTQQDP